MLKRHRQKKKKSWKRETHLPCCKKAAPFPSFCGGGRGPEAGQVIRQPVLGTDTQPEPRHKAMKPCVSQVPPFGDLGSELAVQNLWKLLLSTILHHIPQPRTGTVWGKEGSRKPRELSPGPTGLEEAGMTPTVCQAGDPWSTGLGHKEILIIRSATPGLARALS